MEHDPRYIKSNQGRTYMTVAVNDNVVRWSESFLSQRERAESKEPLMGIDVRLGALRTTRVSWSSSPREIVWKPPPGRRVGPSLLIHAANYNSQRVVNRKLELPSKATAEPTRRREARHGRVHPSAEAAD